MANDKILTAEQETKLRQPIDDYIGKIQEQIDGLRKDGTDQVVALQNTIDGVKRDINKAIAYCKNAFKLGVDEAKKEYTELLNYT